MNAPDRLGGPIDSITSFRYLGWTMNMVSAQNTDYK